MDNLGGFSEDEKKLQEDFDDFYLDVYDDIKKCARFTQPLHIFLQLLHSFL
jgi:hypothetical protein